MQFGWDWSLSYPYSAADADNRPITFDIQNILQLRTQLEMYSLGSLQALPVSMQNTKYYVV